MEIQQDLLPPLPPPLSSKLSFAYNHMKKLDTSKPTHRYEHQNSKLYK